MKTLRSIFFLLLALPIFAAQQTINTGTNPNDGAGDSLRTAFTKVNANFTDLYNTSVFSNSIVQWSKITNTPATLAGYGITNGITAATAASTYAPLASPTFTGTVTIPSGASIAGYLTTNAAASTYASLSGPVFTNSLTLPNWSTANRPASPTAGMIGWNTDLARFDHYVGTNGWKDFVRLDGDTMTGLLVLSADPSAALGAATKQYVDVKAPLASPTFTGVPAVPTAAVDTSTTQAASTAFVLGQASSATPLIDGTAAVGTSTRYARGDHVHPTDTTRSPLASPTFTGAIGVTGGTITGSSTPVLNATQTWNNAATTFTGELINITDTASAAGSMLIDCKVGGTSFFNVTKAGKLNIGQRGGGIDTSTDYYTKLTGYFGDLIGQTSSGSTYLPASIFFTSALDAGLSREGAGILGQRTGVVAQAFRVYNTYTDASNYERATVDFTTSANVLTIGSAKAGTGSSRAVNFIVGGVTALTLGTAGDVQLPKTITAAGTTGAQTINKASGSVNLAAAATSLVVTDSLVSTSSVIICTVGSNDTTCKSVQAVAASGSFTIYPNAAPTAETRVNFIITN